MNKSIAAIRGINGNLLLPPVFILMFCAFTFTDRVAANPILAETFIWGGVGLALFYFLVLVRLANTGQDAAIKVTIVKAHYIQMAMHLCVFAYWGWYWQAVYQQAVLILAQLVFVHVFDMLVRWIQGKPWLLGFGRFPIILSTNLFLWFRDDWFYYQFLMIAFGVLAKEFITWDNQGRRCHIFNPSAISLSVASLILIFSGNTHITWGDAISNTLSYPPYIYLWIFMLGLVVQYFFHVTLVTFAAAATLLAAGALYYGLSGVYFFLTSDIPIAVFLGLHLLVTDPVTSPKTDAGRIVFGIGYGLSVMILFELLDRMGAPTFYDKLLAVPLLNLSIQAIDRFVAWGSLNKPFLRLSPVPGRRNLIYMMLWVGLFAAWNWTSQIGSQHPGRQSAFWEQACAAGKRNGCRNLFDLVSKECKKGQAYACAKLGTMYHRGQGDVAADKGKAYQLVKQACTMGLQEACVHLDAYRPAVEETQNDRRIPLFPWEK